MRKKILILATLTLLIYAFPVRFLSEDFMVEKVLILVKNTLFLGVVYLLSSAMSINSNGLLQFKNSITSGMNIYLFILLVYFFVIQFSSGLPKINNIELLVVAIFAIFSQVVCEEIIFRFYIPRAMQEGGLNTGKIIIYSSIIFSLFHLVNFLRMGISPSLLNQIIFAFFSGVLLSSLYVLSKSISTPIIVHFLFNLPSGIKNIVPQNSVPIPNEFNYTFLIYLSEMLSVLLVFSPLIGLSIFCFFKARRKVYPSSSLPYKKNCNQITI